MHPSPPPAPSRTSRLLPAWQVALVWVVLVVAAAGVVVPLPLLLLPDGLVGLAVMAVSTLVLAPIVAVARGTVVALRIDPSGIEALRILGSAVRVARAEVRDVVVATAFMVPTRHGDQRWQRFVLVGHDGRSLLAASWTSEPFDPAAFVAPWGMRPVPLSEPMRAPELDRRIPGATTRIERLGPGLVRATAVLLAVEGVVVVIAILVRASSA
ncbi:hypothetical protein [Agrococcus sp. SGAir0287]|uniref:hypothetical protein n=1 Tax=Agrococcus sp. SGAir0287 TaxID=2070347 RepID=UPI0010CCC7D6|nr:hypothetical protein [Agrococcus sp. SGAir0287]QCR19458.1 hypothetical protein C1N71_08475 [Agrococcus sp. SGAir0287]